MTILGMEKSPVSITVYHKPQLSGSHVSFKSDRELFSFKKIKFRIVPVIGKPSPWAFPRLRPAGSTHTTEGSDLPRGT